MKMITKVLSIGLLSLMLVACAATPFKNIREQSDLAQGRRFFEQGYYKSALHTLLPLACDGSAEAQYAVGYMYYYGEGVGQDTDTGIFWISRSAALHYAPAVTALGSMSETRSV